MCPFLGSEKIQYDDGAVLALLRESPHLASMRFTYRCGIGESYPLALVIALGGSLTLVQLMVNACPDALKEKLSGKRNVLHYPIAEGVDIEIVKYLTTQNPNLVLEVHSFNATIKPYWNSFLGNKITLSLFGNIGAVERTNGR